MNILKFKETNINSTTFYAILNNRIIAKCKMDKDWGIETASTVYARVKNTLTPEKFETKIISSSPNVYKVEEIEEQARKIDYKHSPPYNL